jgi:nucleoside-diphosphate-sugar epimerase
MSNNDEHHVIFGTGPVGLAVMDALLAQDKQVRLVNRSGRADVPAGVEVIKGDASVPDSTREICKGASVVYNCTNPPYDKWPELFPTLQNGVLEGAAAAEAKLIVIENVYMYGPTGGRPMTEDLPYAAETRKGRTRARMSEELLAAHQSGKVRVAVGRASDFFGPRTLNSMMGERVFYPALEGKSAQALGDVDRLHTQSYIPDIGRGLVVLAEHDQALGQNWHLPGPETVTTRQFIDMIFDETGYPAKIQVAPKILVKALGLFNPTMHEIVEMLYEFEEDFVLDTSKFEQAFGNIATPLPEAIHTTVEWYRQNPGYGQ